MDENISTGLGVGGITVPDTTGSGMPVTVTVVPGEDWQKRFTGLQQVLQRTLEQTGWQKLDALPKRGEVETWRNEAGKGPSLQAQIDTLTAEKTAGETERLALAGRIKGLELDVHKASLLATHAPDLYPFLNYIPTREAETEQLKEFETFRQTLGRVVAPGNKLSLPATPSSQAPASSQMSATDLWVQMMQAKTAGNQSEYERLKELWYKL
jgi:hypothetical protein